MRALFLTLLVVVVLWDVAWLAMGVAQTTPWRLKGRLAAGERPLLLDVRTPLEYSWFHIPGAVNRPEALYDLSAVEGEDRARPVVVVCMTGHRSPFVAKRLKDRGFSAVSNLTFGMAGWLASGGETVPEHKA